VEERVLLELWLIEKGTIVGLLIEELRCRCGLLLLKDTPSVASSCLLLITVHVKDRRVSYLVTSEKLL
jgi:hypothetical protein